MRTVEQGNLSLMIRCLRLSDEHVQTSLVSRELSTELFTGHVLSLLDNPKVEYLSLNNEVVLVANLLLNLSNLLAWETWNDTVNEGSANVVVLLKPLLEAFVVLAEVVLPQLDILADAVLQVVTVEEDELTRHDDKSLLWVAAKCLVTTEEELNELAWVRRCRSIGELT